MIAGSEIARLKVMLDDVEPAVLRRIEVPLAIRLDRLHAALQAALGWKSSHLWEFRTRNISWGIPDPSWDEGPHDARKTTLQAVIEQTGVKKLTYLYDFGDGWEHTIKIEHIGAAAAGEIYPRLLEATGCCPPEDIGGPPGYAEFLETIADPDHERHDEMTEYCNADFDPNAVNVPQLQCELAGLAKRWSRKAPSKRKTS